jgi:acyl-CoA thioesterase FadM
MESLAAWAAASPVAAGAAAVAGAAFLALHAKGLPFAFHARTAWVMLAGVLRHGGPRARRGAATDAAEIRDRVLLSDLDYNMHVNNSIYPVWGDLARTALFARLYGGSLAAFRRMPIHNAGVATLFLRELRLLDPVVVRARLVGGDDRKWVYVALEYVHGRTGRLHALALTKMVFKAADRKTVPPREALAALGFPPDSLPPAIGGGGSDGDVYGPLLVRLQAALEADCGWQAPPEPGTPANDDTEPGESRGAGTGATAAPSSSSSSSRSSKKRA